MAIVHITEENYESEVLQSDKPVLIDFWAGWCGPCKMLSPIIEEIAGERDDIKVCKLNVDDVMSIAQKFKVTGIPTLVIMKNGEMAAKEVGFRSKDELVQFIESEL